MGGARSLCRPRHGKHGNHPTILGGRLRPESRARRQYPRQCSDADTRGIARRSRRWRKAKRRKDVCGGRGDEPGSLPASKERRRQERHGHTAARRGLRQGRRRLLPIQERQLHGRVDGRPRRMADSYQVFRRQHSSAGVPAAVVMGACFCIQREASVRLISESERLQELEAPSEWRIV